MKPSDLPLRYKATMILAFVAAMGVWSWVVITTVHSLPMWGVYVLDAALVVFIGVVFGREWLARRNAARRNLPEVEIMRPTRLPRGPE